jgi:excisionase family DNA binding protein
MEKKFLSVQETAELLGVNVQTVYRWIYGGKIKTHSVGRKYRKSIPIEEINKFIK